MLFDSRYRVRKGVMDVSGDEVHFFVLERVGMSKCFHLRRCLLVKVVADHLDFNL
jgi:hypothetical protein